MKGVLPRAYWFVLLALAAVSVALGIVRLRQAPMPVAQARALMSGRGIDPGFSQWVAAYTGGMRSVRDAIRIQFTERLDSASRVQALSSALLTIQPEIAGKLVWEDARTLAFWPDTVLPFNQVYGVELDLGGLFDIQTEKFKRFSFAFQTGPLRGRFMGLGMTDKGDLRVTLQTSDFVAASQAEEAVAGQNITGRPAWQHSADGLRHTAVYTDPRTDSPLEAALTADLERLGGEGQASIRINLPAQGVFAPIAVEESEEGNHSLRIAFSYPLNKRQNLKGLAFLKNYATPEAMAEGNELQLSLPEDAYGDAELVLNSALQAENGKSLGKGLVLPVSLHPALPGVRLPSLGYIVPESGAEAFVAFEARALRQANVELYRIYANNVPEFLAGRRLSDPQESFYQKTMGRPIGRIVVDLPEDRTPGTYSRYKVDVSRYLADAPTALHYVRVSFSPEQMRFPCPDVIAVGKGMTPVPEEAPKPPSGYDDEEEYYDSEGGWHGQYQDYESEIVTPAPCLDSYAYSPPEGIEGGRIQVGSYLLRSNLGLQARAGAPGQVDVIATDIRSAEVGSPGTELEFAL